MQETLERAIEAVTQERVKVEGSGRTDAGAHALSQVVTFPTSSSLPARTLQRALNAVLPRDIAVTDAGDTRSDFHPRFDASRRVYRYLIWNRPVRSPFWLGRAAHVPHPLDVFKMDEAAGTLCGTRDFGAFVPRSLAGNRNRTVYRAFCRKDGDLVTVQVEASGFMRQMVRSIVGTLVDVGRGKLSIPDFQEIVANRDRALASRTMESGGLYLVDVQYSDTCGGRPSEPTGAASDCPASPSSHEEQI